MSLEPTPLSGSAVPHRPAHELPSLEARLADRPHDRDRLSETLSRANERCVDHVHVEPSADGWRLRWRHDDALVEHRLADDDGLPTALGLLAERERPTAGALRSGEARDPADPVRRATFTTRLDGARHVITLDARRTAAGDAYVLALHGRALAPPGLDALVDDPARLRTLRALAARPVGWLPVAAASRLDGERVVRALAQELASPERKLLCVEPPRHPPLALVSQLDASHDAASLLALDPDAILLAGTPTDATLAHLAARASEDLFVVQRLGARGASDVVRRLLCLGLAPAWLALSVPAIVVRHRVRTLCPGCRRPAPPDCGASHWLGTLRATRVGDVSAWLERSFAPRFEEGEGCPACEGLGGSGARDVTDVVVPREDVREALLRGDVDFALRRVDADGGLAATLTALVDAGTISAAEATRHLAPRY